MQKSSNHVLLFAGIILIAANLRTSIASVGPLIPLIREDLGISNGLAGSLTTLTLLTFALFSLFSPRIGKRLGNGRAIFLGIFLLTLGVGIRVLGGVELLFVGTALTGIGIVIANVLLIPFFKAHLPGKLGILTAILSTGMSLFAAIASGISVPLAEWGLGWRGSLASWGVLMLLALAVWFPQALARPKAAPISSAPKVQVWRSRLAWQVTLFMGAQSVMYFTMVTWLPELLISKGMSPVQSGLALSYMQIISLVGTFFVPGILIRIREQHGVILGVGIAYLIGYSLLFFDQEYLIYGALSIIGIGSGASLSIAYTLISLRTDADQTTSDLSGMVQSAGYILAALGPLLFGISLDLVGNWDFFNWFLLLMTVQFLVFGWGAGKDRKI